MDFLRGLINQEDWLVKDETGKSHQVLSGDITLVEKGIGEDL